MTTGSFPYSLTLEAQARWQVASKVIDHLPSDLTPDAAVGLVQDLSAFVLTGAPKSPAPLLVVTARVRPRTDLKEHSLG